MLCSSELKSPSPWRPCFSTNQNLANNFWRGLHKDKPCEIIPNSDQWFKRRRFFKNSSCPYNTKSPFFPPPPTPQQPCFSTDQNFANNFLKKSTQRTFLWNYFKIRPGVSEKMIFLWISSCLYSAKSPPPNGSHVFQRITISRTVFEKGHSRNNPVKLFQNLTSGFRVEFWRISLKSSEKSLPPWWPCFLTDQNFANNFEKGHPRNNPA